MHRLFRDAESYHATRADKTCHRTRHPSRLDRELGRKRFGDEGYAMEELVAELGSTFLSADLELTPEVREDHVKSDHEVGAEMTDNAAPRHSGQWKKGQSGNPAGMPKGTRHRATMLAEKLMEDDAENIVRAVVNAAKAGDPTAMRLCVERLVPLRKGRPVVFDLPPVKTAAHIAGAVGELARAMAAGELTVEEASAASSVIEMQRRAIETSDFEVRLRALEAEKET
jgi:Zincin-like metallopeptidase/Family of unknown function (DUF5681)